MLKILDVYGAEKMSIRFRENSNFMCRSKASYSSMFLLKNFLPRIRKKLIPEQHDPDFNHGENSDFLYYFSQKLYITYQEKMNLRDILPLQLCRNLYFNLLYFFSWKKSCYFFVFSKNEELETYLRSLDVILTFISNSNPFYYLNRSNILNKTI